MVRLLGFLLLFITVISAYGQTPGPFIQGQPLPAAQLNAEFATKQDYPAPSSLGVDGVSALRLLPIVNNKTVFLNYHTNPGDLGLGNFVGVTGAIPGTYVDNNGTVFIPAGGNGSAAWLRVWDQQNADMGWWGAKFDHIADEYNIWAQAISLFSFGGQCSAAFSGSNVTLNVHAGFNTAKPLVYAGCNGAGITITGTGFSYAQTTTSYINYTGPATADVLVIFAANTSTVKNLSILVNNARNGIHLDADNTYCQGSCNGTNPRNRISGGPYSPGAPVTLSVASTYNMTAGTSLGLGYGLATFEVVTVAAVGSGTITVERLLNTHSANEIIGGGSPTNAVNIRDVWVAMSTILTAPTGAAIVMGNKQTTETNQISDINVYNSGCTGVYFSNATVKISNGSGGSGTIMDILSGSPVALTAGTYVGDSLYLFGSGLGNIMQPTKIVTVNSSTQYVLDTSYNIASELVGFATPAHSCFTQTEGGNVKNVILNFFLYSFVEVPVDLRSGSGYNDIYALQGSGAFDSMMLLGTATFNIFDFEDESYGSTLFRAACGVNPGVINIFGGSWETGVPQTGANAGVALVSSCTTSLYGTQIFNDAGPTTPYYRLPAKVRAVCYVDNCDAAFTSIGSWFQFGANGTPYILDTGGNDMVNWYNQFSSIPKTAVDTKNMRLVLLNNVGGDSNALLRLDNILPNARNMQQTPTSGAGQNGVFGTQTATYNNSFSGASNWASATLPFSVFTAASNPINWDLFQLPAKTKVTGVYVDVTAGFTGPPCACTFQIGTTSGASDIIINRSAATTNTQFGLVAADLAGGVLAAANAVQGGWLPSWSADSHIWVSLAGVGNLGNASATLLTGGSLTVYVQTQRMTAP